MDPIVVGILGLIGLIVLFLIGIPVGFSMAITGLVGFIYLTSVEAGFNIVAIDFFSNFIS